MSEFGDNPVRASSHSGDISTSSDESARPRTDDELLESVRTKDQSAMAELFDRYGRMVYSVALRVLKDAGNAEDVMQDVFFQLWEKPRGFLSGRGSLSAWLLVVARNRAIDALRKRRPSDAVEDVVLAGNANVALETERRTMMDKVRVVLHAATNWRRSTAIWRWWP